VDPGADVVQLRVLDQVAEGGGVVLDGGHLGAGAGHREREVADAGEHVQDALALLDRLPIRTRSAWFPGENITLDRSSP